ncbi:MAG: DUF1926 domain-containing protein [Candidatus Omnitrophica bacterium]|nr:DUF1926 domain-containing protein [Candidatus Omnitrophota bacterium]MBU1127901.1 DUF1926 domain-containing protein [Candidatus Omnitrophota bacterium]MBU1784585.1 DUF1926 domain-containing protein [Candidatus Omnitrophota bacterium]
MGAALVMAIHFHQPVGNFDQVVEGICDRCYVPFITTMKQYPRIKMSFHFSGSLLEWMEAHRPEIIDSVKSMVKTGQIEMIGGAFYEPILPSIPARDVLSQISLLTEYISKRFSKKPKGAWIAERVWEPGLPSLLNDAGVQYVILDDTHFMYAGMGKEKLYGYYTTEDNGKSVAVFPTDTPLRYSIPFRMPFESLEYMKTVASNAGDPIFIYGDDGEKFGEWPGTYHWVYEEFWLKKFFDALTSAGDWLKTMTFSECLQETRPLGQVYLPSSAYSEMLEWALPSHTQEKYEDILEEIRAGGQEERYKPYIRGGFWRNFLTKYPESGHMHKKMLYVSDKLNDLKKKQNGSPDLAEASLDLYRGQCNCAYWHGVFGGLYLFHLRRAIYHHLIKSETSMDIALHGDSEFCSANVLDIDADGFDEVVLENKRIALYFDPSDGGTLQEIDSKIVCQNLMNVLTRRHEAYHRRIIKKIRENEAKPVAKCETIHDAIQVVDPGIEDHIVYDRYTKYSMIDHFISGDTAIEDFARSSYREEGDFIGKPYSFNVKRGKKQVKLVLEREGAVSNCRVRLKKEIVLRKEGSKAVFRYTLTNLSEKTLDVMFAPEFNIIMPNADSPEYRVILNNSDAFGMKEKTNVPKVKTMLVKGENRSDLLRLDFRESCRLWHFPVETVSQSETSYELNYQCSTFLPAWRVSIEKKKEMRVSLELGLMI